MITYSTCLVDNIAIEFMRLKSLIDLINIKTQQKFQEGTQAIEFEINANNGEKTDLRNAIKRSVNSEKSTHHCLLIESGEKKRTNSIFCIFVYSHHTAEVKLLPTCRTTTTTTTIV